MIQILIHMVVHSVMNIIEQTQGTDFPSVPQTTKLILAQSFVTTTSTRGHNTPSWTKHMH